MRSPIVYVAGTFDLFHAGHVRFLESCTAHGKVVVAVDDDKRALEIDRHPPICSLVERLTVVKACKYVAKAYINEGDSQSLIEKVHADYLAHGNGPTGEGMVAHLGLTLEWLDERGIELLHIPLVQGISTSEIIQRVRLSKGIL